MTDKERLEEIEKNLDPLGYGMGGHLISVNDIHWLVKYAKEQAERVQELESNSYNAHLERLLDRREQQNKRYKQALEHIQREIHKAIYTPKKHKWNSDFEREFERGKTRGLIQASDIVKEALEKLEGEEWT